jgi:hypothetical protein
MIRSVYTRSPARFTYRAATGGRLDDWTCALSTGELWAIPRRLTLRDFISGVRDCTRGRLVTDPGIAGPPAPGTGGPPAVIGPSPDLLGPTLGMDPRAPRGVSDRFDDVLSAEAPPDAFDRPAFTTFYGIGDSDMPESEHRPRADAD